MYGGLVVGFCLWVGGEGREVGDMEEEDVNR